MKCTKGNTNYSVIKWIYIGNLNFIRFKTKLFDYFKKKKLIRTKY